MEKENLQQDLKEATSSLLEMAKNACWNSISDNATYLISEIKNDELSTFEKRKERKRDNDNRTPKSLEQVSTELKSIYENLYDVNLYIYKSEKDNTIIEIQYYPKSSLESGFYETIKNNEPMLHCKIRIPPEHNDKKGKFDVNCETR